MKAFGMLEPGIRGLQRAGRAYGPVDWSTGREGPGHAKMLGPRPGLWAQGLAGWRAGRAGPTGFFK